MPELEQEAVVDNAISAPAEGDGEGSPAEGADKEEGKLIAGKFKSTDEVAKAYTEAEKRMHEATEQNKILQQQLEQTKQSAQLSEAIKSLADAQNKKPEPEPLDIDAFASDFAEEHGIEATAVKRLLEVQDAWVRDATQNTATKDEVRALQEQNKRLEAALNDMGGNIMKSAPEYTENKEIVDRLTQRGMTLSDAIEEAKIIRSQFGPSQPDRINPPSSMGGTRVSSQGLGKREILTQDEKAQWKADGFTDADIAKYEMEQRREIELAMKEA